MESYIKYIPWKIKGFSGNVWQVFIVSNRSVSGLRKIKEELNNFNCKGLLVIQTESKAAQRLGWSRFDGNIYYRYSK